MAEVAEVNGVKKTSEETPEKIAAKAEPKEADTKTEPKEEENDDSSSEEEMQMEESGEVTDLERQIIRQIEYYFGDINLPRDKFLQEQIKLDDGWIPLEVMLKFKRLANLSKEIDIIVAAMNKSKTGLMEVSDDKKKIRRNPGRVLPQQTEERRKELQSRTVYCKGFPQDSTLDALLEYFQPYGPIDSLFMRQFRDKNAKTFRFKGSAFVLFATKERAEDFLRLEEVKFGETVLLKLWQTDYMEKKKAEKKGKNQKEGAEKSEEPEQEGKSFPRGTVIHLKGEFGQMARDEIKNKVEELGGKVAYVSYSPGDEECWVRLQEENSAKEIFEQLEDQKMLIKEVSVDVRMLEDEEEETFLKKAMSDMLQRRQNSRQSFKNKRGGRGGNRGGGRGGFQNRKRKADGAGEGPAAKHGAKE